jgi:hypothetical protein
MRRPRPPAPGEISRPRPRSARAVAVALVAALLSILGTASPAAAQDPDPEPIARVPAGEDGWNGPRALELVERARDRRRQPVADSTLRSYRADVTGHVYFFIDREDDPEPVLLRADQVALELYWM